MGFASALGKAINEQFSFGENTTTSLDTNGDRVGNFGLLGDFAKKFDQSAERTYISSGLINNVRPRMREILFQQPELTIIIKKRMFSSLIENSRMDLLEEKERMFVRASKKLFQNKCRLLSAYERLSKVDNVAAETGQFNLNLVPIVLQDIAEIDNALGNLIDPETRSAMDTLRRAMVFGDSENFTTWVNDYESVFSGDLGEGTGVIELTTVASINTSVTSRLNGGSASITIEDPYKIMHITNKDIDRAITDSANFFKNAPVGRLAEIETRNLVDSQKNELNGNRFQRRASRINFILSPQTFISKRLRAIIESEGREINFTYNSGLVGVGGSVDIDPKEMLTPEDLAGVGTNKNGLTEDDARLFKEIVENIFLLMGIENTTGSTLFKSEFSKDAHEYNAQVNYVRNRMRKFFAGRSIIQSMDVVNVFMTTKTTTDTKLNVGFPGFQTSGGAVLGQTINNLVSNINTTLTNISGSNASPDEIEKSAIVGPNFPSWLWRMFRNNFTKQGAGTAVFVGLVKSTSQGFSSSNGKHTVTVECEDNSGYFTKSQINIKPALNVFNSALYDPLTPFDVSFDASTGQSINSIIGGEFPPLLPENQRLLETRALKFQRTGFRGQNANQILYKTKNGEIVFGKLRQVLADSDGFVYRWKQGVQSITKVERAAPQANIQSELPPRLTASPFAGQDVMNVLSLLVTGQPYNYNTFLKSALANGNDILAYDPAENSDTHASYIDGLIRELSKRNVIWGNFIPFKSLSVSDESFAFIRQGQADLTRKQGRLQTLLRKRAAKIDQRSLTVAGFDNEEALSTMTKSQTQALDKELNLLDLQIEEEQEKFSEMESQLYAKNKGSIKIAGDDISLGPGFDEFDGNNAVTQDQKSTSRYEMRKRINALALRRLWKVKANADANLFIVDDQYDKNYDIQAFERKIDGALNLFNSEYTTVDGQIESVSKILGLEAFADSQGNIRVRPPLYNRMPSSVFYKMFKERDDTGIKVFPDFLETLLFNQVKGLTDKIEITEDEIRLRAIALGIVGVGNPNWNAEAETDVAIKKFLSGGNSPAGGAPGFNFLSDPSTGKIGGINLQAIPDQASPDAREQAENSNIKELERLNSRASGEAGVTKAFDIVTRINVIKKRDASQRLLTATGTGTMVDVIRQRLFKNKGVKSPTLQELFSNPKFRRVEGVVSELDALSITKDIAMLVSERQKLVLELSNVTKNLSEGLQINKDDEGGKAAYAPSLNRKRPIPTFLEHMIEDESVDDLGPGSGQRFVIKEHQIISYKINEQPPPFTAVQVNGLFGEGFTDAPSELNINLSGRSGGNALVSAYAVDYDLWYQYGFKIGNSVEAPWASDPEAQCAPFAVTLLNLARRQIFTGSISLSGWNEFYQVGDVVYIEDEDQLFYVEGVSHSFGYNTGLTTTLTLTYGHSPGEYIPTHLDMIGKYLYNAQTFSEQFRSARFDSDGNDVALGAIMVNQSNQKLKDILKGPVGKHNRDVLGKIMYAASGALNTVAVRNIKPVLQIRVFAEKGGPSPLREAASTIRSYLINPTKYSTTINEVMGDTSVQSNFKLNESDVKLVEIDIDNDTKTPSSSAWNATRIIEKNGVPGSSNLNDEIFQPSTNDAGGYSSEEAGTLQKDGGFKLDEILMKNIVDVWVVFEPISDTLVESDQKNQAAQENNAKVAAAKIAGRS